MDINEKISRLYQEYRADIEAARNAEQRGNIDGAKRLYRQAALDLCEMASLESGETKRQRTLHAEEIFNKAKSLEANRRPSTAASSAAAQPGSAPGEKQTNVGEEKKNSWECEGIPSTTFDDVVGMEDVKQLIRQRVINQIRYPEVYAQFKLKGGTGVLLFGLPGTGKTTIARAIAHEFDAPLYTVKGSDVRNKWVGESEKLIRQLFDKARSTPTSLIFFDDFDDLGKKRQDDGDHNDKIIVELINQMDGFQKNTNTIVLLAASNKPWMIDSARMRPGRFEHHFYVPLANHEARILLVNKNLADVPVAPDIDMDRISDLLKGYNGADIVSVVSGAKMAAIQRTIQLHDSGQQGACPVAFDDFVAAAAQHKSSVNPEDIVQLRQYAAQRGIEMPDEM